MTTLLEIIAGLILGLSFCATCQAGSPWTVVRRNPWSVVEIRAPAPVAVLVPIADLPTEPPPMPEAQTLPERPAGHWERRGLWRRVWVENVPAVKTKPAADCVAPGSS